MTSKRKTVSVKLTVSKKYTNKKERHLSFLREHLVPQGNLKKAVVTLNFALSITFFLFFRRIK